MARAAVAEEADAANPDINVTSKFACSINFADKVSKQDGTGMNSFAIKSSLNFSVWLFLIFIKIKYPFIIIISYKLII